MGCMTPSDDTRLVLCVLAYLFGIGACVAIPVALLGAFLWFAQARG
ncbi:hypothetical protein AERO9AM_50032 [Aeromicrobium sp. 9AM]|nr:hypothetical protein AERO9AM_50032 [Aeromicrobium sp. 9AM]